MRDKEKRRREKGREPCRLSYVPSFLFISLCSRLVSPLDTHNQPASRPEGSGRQAVSVSWGGYSDWCCDDDSLEGSSNSPSSPSSLTKPTNRLGDEGRRLMHIAPHDLLSPFPFFCHRFSSNNRVTPSGRGWWMDLCR